MQPSQCRFYPWVRKISWRGAWQLLAWKMSWTEEPGGLQPMGLPRVGHDWSNSMHTQCSRGDVGESRWNGMSVGDEYIKVLYAILSLLCVFKISHNEKVLKERMQGDYSNQKLAITLFPDLHLWLACSPSMWKDPKTSHVFGQSRFQFSNCSLNRTFQAHL